MSETGRPTAYKEEYNEQARKLCLLGFTDKQLADFFDVTEQTINNWKKDYPEFFESLKKGKDIADANVAYSFYQRAIGYEHPEDKIFNNNGKEMIVKTIKHYPPDTAAALSWLKNRQAEKWRDKQEIEHSGAMSVNIGKEFEGI
jgi:transcriptional regulator with XRE-family HTH domain